MADTTRRPLTPAQLKAIRIRKAIAARAAANDNQPRRSPRSLLAACIEAGGFDQNASYGG